MDLLAAKEKRELTSDLRHLPEDCEQLVEAAERLASKSRIELSEWDAGVDQAAHEVLVISAVATATYMLLGLLAAVMLDFVHVRLVSRGLWGL